MKENEKQSKFKLIRDIVIALVFSVVLVLGFWQVYHAKLEKKLHALENAVEHKQYKYLCIDNEYDRKMRIYKRRNSDINIAFLEAFKSIFDNQIIFYLSNESIRGKAEVMIVLERKIAEKFFNNRPDFSRKDKRYCIALK